MEGKKALGQVHTPWASKYERCVLPSGGSSTEALMSFCLQGTLAYGFEAVLLIEKERPATVFHALAKSFCG